MTELTNKFLKIRECRDEAELLKYAQSSDTALSLEIARSAHATPRVLDLLTRHVSVVVRHAVALNSNTSIVTLERLKNDKDQLVRDYAKTNLSKRTQN